MWYNLLNSAQTAQEKRKGYSMKIVLVGGGKVGTALARQLSEEGHNVTVIDTNKARVEHIGESYDVMSILGNGSSITTLSEAGVEEADVFAIRLVRRNYSSRGTDLFISRDDFFCPVRRIQLSHGMNLL